MPVVQVNIAKIIFQTFLYSVGVFAALYLINPNKASFPTVVVAGLLLIASLLQNTTLIATIRKSGTWRVLLGTSFLLIFIAVPVGQNWRENGYGVPMVFALVVAILSLGKYFQDKISNNDIT